MASPDLFLPSAWLELPDGRTYQLRAGCSIGRQPDNNLVLDLPTLSRHHAKLTLESEGYMLTDLRSRNGSFVNGTPVTRPVTMQDGDEIRLGETVLRFRCVLAVKLRNFVPNIAATQRIDQLRERQCWMMLVDIAGSATLNQAVGSSAAHRQIQDWIQALQPVIEAHEGRINSYLGDALYVYWIAESTKPATVLGALAAIEVWRPSSTLVFRNVIHFGAALFTHSEFGQEITGHDVNFMFRSEKLAKKFGVSTLVTDAAAAALGVREQFPEAGRSGIEGLTGTFKFYTLPPGFSPK